jgi:DHA1 family bicyclomycin/chloramphenicol resistance-like MFS transporter
MTAAVRRPSLAFLIVLGAVSPGSIHIIGPSLPLIARDLAVDGATVQWSLTLFITTLSIGQLLIGSLSDRFGRRTMIFAGMSIYVVGALTCAFAPSLPVLLLGRTIQGVGACAGSVLGRAMIRDTYPLDRRPAAIAYLSMGVTVAPTVSPVIGGFLDPLIGWRGIFDLLAAIAATLLLLAAWQPETLTTRSATFGLGAFFRNFFYLLRQRAFAGYVTFSALQNLPYFAFVGVAPVLSLNVIGMTPADYGLYYACIPASYILGSFFTARLRHRLTPRCGTLVGCFGIALAGCTMAVLLIGLGPSPLVLFGPMATMVFMQGLVMPHVTTMILGMEPRLVGAASGTLGFVQMSSGALGSMFISFFDAHATLPIALMIALASMAAVPAALFGLHHSRQFT